MGSIVSQFGSKSFAEVSAIVTNQNALWRHALMDNKDGTRVINADGTVRHEDHRRIMEQVTEVRRNELNGIADLISAGLTSSESIETMLVGVESVNEFQAAKRSMNPVATPDNDTNFLLSYTPLPITHSGWSIPWRQSGFGYKRSLGLSESVRQVAESLENMLFNGASDIRIAINGGTPIQIYGYANHPNRSTQAISDWSDLATNATKIIPETLAMVKKAKFTNGSAKPKSLMMYVGNDIWMSLQEDYSASKGDRTFIERIKAITEIMDVKPAEKLLSKDVILVEMSDRTIQLAMAADITTVPHQRLSMTDPQIFTTYAAMTPIIRVDRNSHTGIVHGVEAL